MSTQCEVTGKRAASAPLSFFERYLTIWVFICIVVGIALGQFLPGVFQAVGAMEIAKVELPGEPARYEVACKPEAHGKAGHGDSHADHHHHYFHCSSCGQVYLLHSCPGPMDDLVPKGFQVQSHEVTLHGVCASCAETADKGRAGKAH